MSIGQDRNREIFALIREITGRSDAITGDAKAHMGRAFFRNERR
jgi:hypothetical protein